MTKKLLKDLVDIRTGYPFRGRPKRSATAGIRLVQMRDIQPDQPWVSGELEQVEAPANWEKHRLHVHDVLVAVRGHRNNAAMFDGATDAVAASHLAVLKFKGEALPHYLTWYLNLPQTQQQLGTMRSGSGIPFLPLAELEQMAIPVPSIEQQHRIAELYKLWQEEQQLMTQIQDKRRELMAGVFQCLLTNQTTA